MKRVLLFAVVALAVSACGSNRDNAQGLELGPAFLTPVAAAQEAGLTVYWLGPSFEVDGLVFTTRKAKFPEGIQGIAVQGLELGYSVEDEPGAGGFYLKVFPRSEWAAVEEKVMNPRIPGEPRPVIRREVTVGGRRADLLLLPLGTRPVNELWLILDLGDVVVVAEAGAGGAVYPGGPDYSPFINNPDLLIALMEDLRPYPE